MVMQNVLNCHENAYHFLFISFDLERPGLVLGRFVEILESLDE